MRLTGSMQNYFIFLKIQMCLADPKEAPRCLKLSRMSTFLDVFSKLCVYYRPCLGSNSHLQHSHLRLNYLETTGKRVGHIQWLDPNSQRSTHGPVNSSLQLVLYLRESFFIIWREHLYINHFLWYQAKTTEL